jgi:hypothetical protein
MVSIVFDRSEEYSQQLLQYLFTDKMYKKVFVKCFFYMYVKGVSISFS